MITSIICLFEIEREYREYLDSHGAEFDEQGYPVFKPSMFATTWPEAMVTYSHRNNPKLVRDPGKTAICFFDSDRKLFPRLEKVLDDLAEYKRFMAVVGMDITFTSDMDVELQQFINLINQMFTMILAINGIKIILNTRSGGLDASAAFRNVPRGILVASGFLGCKRLLASDHSYLIKVLSLLPNQVCIYGKHDPVAESQMERFGIDFKVFKDVHRRTKYKEVYYG
ncbi:MAG: hypothetical protein IKR22_01840 [Clostridiales bacterium]|nr:hypothetical protein [Clostridiales bacterium]